MTPGGGSRKTSGLGLAATIVFVVILASAILAPVLAPYGPADFVGDIWEMPSSSAWLGTDNLGRDMLSRLLYGGRLSIGLSFASTVLGFLLGGIGGITAAVSSTWVDHLLSRAVDCLMAVPQLIMALVVLSALGTSLSILVCTMAVLDATRVFRLSRLVASGIYRHEYVENARLRGERLPWIICREILPNAVPPLMAEFGIRFSLTLLFIASLSFLGLGVQPPDADWGGMVRDNAPALGTGSVAPLVPAIAITLVAISVNLIVDWFVQSQGRGVRS